jgi:uncharacterized protein
MEVRSVGGAVSFSVRVTPRASRNTIDGEYQGAIKVRLTAPPLDDRANEALRHFLAARLRVSPSAVTIVSGEKSRTKVVSVVGVTPEAVALLAESR